MAAYVSDRTGMPWPRIRTDDLFAKAAGHTKLSDYGDDAWFREGLDVLVEALRNEAHVPTWSRIAFRSMMQTGLENRLYVQDFIRKHPEIHTIPIQRPIVIVGLRSGTTMLHHLLAQDPRARVLTRWQASFPCQADGRERARKLWNDFFLKMAPELRFIHHVEVDSPDECNPLFFNSVASDDFGIMYDIPSYIRWLRDESNPFMLRAYEYYRTQIQAIIGQAWDGHLVVKSTIHHMLNLHILLQVFPDATIVICHRHPAKIIASAVSLNVIWEEMRLGTKPDVPKLARKLLDAYSEGIAALLATRKRIGEDRFFDVAYEELIADPIKMARNIYEKLNYDFSPEFEQRMRSWLEMNPKNKHGKHTYSLDTACLTRDAIDAAFAPYLKEYAWALGPAA